jgi:hypothetical protein
MCFIGVLIYLNTGISKSIDKSMELYGKRGDEGIKGDLYRLYRWL